MKIFRFLTLALCIITIHGDGGVKSKKIDLGSPQLITADQLHDYLAFIASDELEGRDTPSKGQDIAAKFIATHLSRWGLIPAGDSGSFYQRIALRRTKVIASQTSLKIDTVSFSFGDDFLVNPVSGIVSAPLVYVQHGYILKEKGIDPYATVNVSGKIMVVQGGLPPGVKYTDFKGKRGEDWVTPSDYAKKHGALGVITLPSFQQLRSWDRQRANAEKKGIIEMEKFIDSTSPGRLLSVTLSSPILPVLFSGQPVIQEKVNDRAYMDSLPSFEFTSTKMIEINVEAVEERVFTQNIVAMLEGTDSKLKKEYIAFGAHYDHVGIGNPVSGDSIYNGADDDGSGTVSLMAMAEAFSKGKRTQRSILFVWHTGEEKGLWGSKYYTSYPTVPIGSIVAQLNVDMIGRSIADNDTTNPDMSKNNEIFVIGSKMMSDDLGKASETVNDALLKLRFNYKYDDPADPMRLFYRSDHYNYVKKGIPIIFYFDGLHEDYHRPSDHVDKIDFDKLMKVTRTIYSTGYYLGNMTKRPQVNKELPATSDEE